MPRASVTKHFVTSGREHRANAGNTTPAGAGCEYAAELFQSRNSCAKLKQ